MKRFLLSFLFLSFISTVTRAANITGCSLNSGIFHGSQTSSTEAESTACSVSTNPPPQMAAAGVSFRMSGNELSTSLRGLVQAPGNAVGNAAISASIDPAALSTDGPVRSGIVKISWFLQSGFGPDPPSTQRMNIALGSLSAACNTLFRPSDCNGPLAPATGTSASTFTLGQPFTLHEDLTLNAVNNFPVDTVIESGSYMSGHTFTFLEADGTTPVPVHLTPEPSFFAPLAFVLTAWGLLLQRSS